MEDDPEYKVCMLYGHHGHVCGGRLTREHVIVFAGKSYQSKWSIISLCAKGHSVDEYQDNGDLNKELNLWVALNRATPEELQAISKAEDYLAKKSRLNRLYGVWEQKIVYPSLQDLPKPQESFNAKVKKEWFLVKSEDMKLIKDIQDYIKDQDDYHMPYPDVIRVAIKKMHEAVEELKNNVQM